jgi:hypothetical protein
MTDWQKIYCCISVNYLSKIEEIIFFKKKLHTFAFLEDTFYTVFFRQKKDIWQRI